MVSGQIPPEENCLPVRVGIWAKVRVSFRVGGQPENLPQYIYIYIVFTTAGFLEVAIESWPEWDLNTQPLNSVQML